jgi:ankyrin repeat protein
VKILVESNPQSVHYKDKDGHIALHEAAYGENIDKNNKDSIEKYNETVKFLIESGSDVNSQNKDGFTPLCSACRMGHLEIIRSLLQNGAEINLTDFQIGLSPLYIAVLYGHLDIVKLMLSEGAKTNIGKGVLGKSGLTALHYAAFLPDNLENVVVIIECLIKSGADINAEAKTDSSFYKQLIDAILYLSHMEDHLIYKFLKNEFMKIIISSSVPDAYFTPLDLAETFGNKRISAYLIDNGGRKSNNNYNFLKKKIFFSLFKKLYAELSKFLY